MMDSFQTSGALGILYAEDFSIESQPAAPVEEPVAAPVPLTQHDIDQACIRAVAAAERAWASDEAVRRREALSAIHAAIGSIRQEIAAHVEQVADGVTRTALSAVAGALPTLCRSHGDTEVQALLHHVLPLLARRTQVVVCVHAALIEAVQADIDAFDSTLAEHISLRAADLPPGDVRVHWEDGSLVRDSAAIRAAIHDGLKHLGLLVPDPEAGHPFTEQPS